MHDLYALAIQATGPVPEEQWTAAVRDKMTQIALHEREMTDFAGMIARAMERNAEGRAANKGWGVIEGTVTRVWINDKVAYRAFVEFAAWSTRSNDFVTEEIRTLPTNTYAEGMALYEKAHSLIGRKVKMFKRPDPTAKNPDQANKDLFHIVDIGPGDPRAAQQGKGNQQGQATQQNAQRSPQTGPTAQQDAPAPEQNHQTGPVAQQDSPGDLMENKQARRGLYQAVCDLYPSADDQWRRNVASQAWNQAGLPHEGEVHTSGLDQAYAHVQQAGQDSGGQ